MDTIRVCIPFEYPGMVEVRNKHFIGYYAGFINNIFNYVMKGSNFSVELLSKLDGIGEFNSTTGLYGGCFGRLQRNQSDVLKQLVNYPLDIDYTKQGDIGISAEFQFLGVYESRAIEEANSVKIESCFKSFELDVWLICLFIALITYMLLMIRKKISSGIQMTIRRELEKFRHDRACHLIALRFSSKSNEHTVHQWKNKFIFKSFKVRRKTNNYFLSNVLAHMLRLGSLNKQSSLFNKLIFTSLSSFSLLVVYYFSSFIKTELVSIDPPEIPTSYKELIDKNINLVFVEGFS